MNDTFTGRWYVRSQINDFVYWEHWQRGILIEVATTSHQIVLDIQLKASLLLKKIGQFWPLYVDFRSFQTQFFTAKNVDFSRIQTLIVGVESEHADHLTTTTAQLVCCFH